MIHGNSNDPVLIKRIGLKVWTLRTEVEAVIEKTLRAQPEKEKLSPEEIQKIKSEYEYRGPVDQRPNLQLIQGGGEEEAEGGEDLEAAMAAAMSGDESPENSEGASGAGSDEDDEDLEAAMAAAMGGGEAKQPSPGAKPSTSALKVIQRKSENIPTNKIFRGITILGEISMDVMYFFSNEQFLEGQSIVIEFQIPKRFVVNAQVAYCRPFNTRSRIISDKKVTTRVAVKFSFLKDGERTLLRQFISSIEPEIQAPPSKASAAASKSEDSDDFDGLDDLGF